MNVEWFCFVSDSQIKMLETKIERISSVTLEKALIKNCFQRCDKWITNYRSIMLNNWTAIRDPLQNLINLLKVCYILKLRYGLESATFLTVCALLSTLIWYQQTAQSFLEALLSFNWSHWLLWMCKIMTRVPCFCDWVIRHCTRALYWIKLLSRIQGLLGL